MIVMRQVLNRGDNGASAGVVMLILTQVFGAVVVLMLVATLLMVVLSMFCYSGFKGVLMCWSLLSYR